MSGSFGGIYISSSGLYSSQAALNVTSSNISNADVEGYTRQQVMQLIISKLYGPNPVWWRYHRIRNQAYSKCVLDASYREENSSLGYWQTHPAHLPILKIVLVTAKKTAFSTQAKNF